MTEVPKIVHDRIAASKPIAQGQGHPDADLLTAFAEQALSTTERESLLGHLALCGICREVLALALPAADVAPTPSTTSSESFRPAPISPKTGKGWLSSGYFAWPRMSWAAVAAAVIVAASLLLVHPGKLNPGKQSVANQTVATSPSPAPGTQIASLSSDQPSVSIEKKGLEPKSDRRFSRHLASAKAASQPHEPHSGMLLAGNKKPSSQPDAVPGSPVSASPMLDNSIATRGANETVEVSSASSEIATLQEPSSLPLTSRNVAPAIEKAKPAPQAIEAEAGAQQDTSWVVSGQSVQTNRNTMTSALRKNLAANITWAIKAGVLQRSLDSGQSWQNALHVDHSLLCQASQGENVWAGGEAGTLFHSADGGLTWLQLKPATHSTNLTSDVTRIDVHSSSKIVLFTTNNQIWTTTDGGQSWNSK